MTATKRSRLLFTTKSSVQSYESNPLLTSRYLRSESNNLENKHYSGSMNSNYEDLKNKENKKNINVNKNSRRSKNTANQRGCRNTRPKTYKWDQKEDATYVPWQEESVLPAFVRKGSDYTGGDSKWESTFRDGDSDGGRCHNNNISSANINTNTSNKFSNSLNKRQRHRIIIYQTRGVNTGGTTALRLLYDRLVVLGFNALLCQDENRLTSQCADPSGS